MTSAADVFRWALKFTITAIVRVDLGVNTNISAPRQRINTGLNTSPPPPPPELPFPPSPLPPPVDPPASLMFPASQLDAMHGMVVAEQAQSVADKTSVVKIEVEQ